MKKNKSKKMSGNSYRHKEDPPDNVDMWFGKYLCGCGSPEKALITLRDILKWFEGENGFDAIKAFEEKHGQGILMLLLYFLTGSDVLEHGGSVYGSWLSPLGKDIKKFLDENPDWEP